METSSCILNIKEFQERPPPYIYCFIHPSNICPCWSTAGDLKLTWIGPGAGFDEGVCLKLPTNSWNVDKQPFKVQFLLTVNRVTSNPGLVHSSNKLLNIEITRDNSFQPQMCSLHSEVVLLGWETLLLETRNRTENVSRSIFHLFGSIVCKLPLLPDEWKEVNYMMVTWAN